MNKKNIVILAAIGFILLVVGVVVIRSRSVATSRQTTEATAPSPEMVIPTVGNDTIVTLTSTNARRAVVVDIEGIPSGTQTIDYSISYQTKQQGLQGIIGTITLTGGETSHQLKRDLGTCSSGTCIYHEVVGKVTLELKFTGSYGDKLYDKEFDF